MEIILLAILTVVVCALYKSLHQTLQGVRAIEHFLKSIGKVRKIEFYTQIDGINRKVTHMFLKITQKLPVSVAFKDQLGNPASVDGAPVWSVTDPSLASLDVAADGLSAFVKPLGPIGSFKVQVNADADLGAGVKTILGELSIDLVSGEAVEVDLTPGAPVDL